MKFKVQFLTFLITLGLFIYAIVLFPFVIPTDLVELTAEFIMLLACIAIMFYIEQLKSFYRVYWIMLIGASLSYIGFFLDFAEELFDERVFQVSSIEDSLQTVGFVTLCIGILYWLALHKSLIAELKLNAETDHLTGLLNRRAFYQIMDRKRKLQPDFLSAFLLMDIDHFKSVNDTYGHAFGDEVLEVTSKSLKAKVRSSDVLIRWGGEEFLLYLDNCSKERSVEIAEELRKQVEQLSFDYQGQQVNCTISIGVYNTTCNKRLEDNINCADQALYKAKHGGRNCVVIYNAGNT